MTNHLRVYLVWTVCAAAVVVFSVRDVHAGGGLPYGSPSYAYYGYAWPFLGIGDRDIPYYAAHPPVYYSHIVARPYGYSPYAYVPGIVTPDYELCSPWHPCQPWRPYWDGQNWQWRANTPECDKPAPESELKATPSRSAMIRNQFYRHALDEPERGHAVAGPLRIRNPYVGVSSGSDTAVRERRPEIVYPLAAGHTP